MLIGNPLKVFFFSLYLRFYTLVYKKGQELIRSIESKLSLKYLSFLSKGVYF